MDLGGVVAQNGEGSPKIYVPGGRDHARPVSKIKLPPCGREEIQAAPEEG